MMQYQQAYDYMMPRLENDLSEGIIYHTAEHTRYVIESATKLAQLESIKGEELTLLKTAALFHDAGFLTHHEEHEQLSCDWARKVLPEFGYSSTQIAQICTLIMATRLPQQPVDKLSKILCDADLYYIGTPDYPLFSKKLLHEFLELGIIHDESGWNQRQIDFLTQHQYFTDSARGVLEVGKAAVLESLGHKQKHRKSFLEIIQDSFFAILGVALAATALKLFLVPNHFFDGGLTGISLLVHELYGVNLGLAIFLFNLPLIVISYFSVGKNFAIRTLLCVLLLGLFLLLIPIHPVTEDKLLISIFGGAILGIGIGFIMRIGAALDGIEVLALFALKRTSFTITEIILAINIFIFSIAAFSFGIETALYSILTYFTATRCIDYVVEGVQAYRGVTIVSGQSEVIKYQLVNKMRKGITVYKGERGYLPGKYESYSDCDILFAVISRLEFRKLKNLVYEIDPDAFVYTTLIKEASGGIIKKRAH